jgi:hypothetical protein
VGLSFHGEVFLLDFDVDRMVNETLYDLILKMCQKWNIKWLFVEGNSLDDYIIQPMQKFLVRNGWPANVEAVHRAGNTGSKIDAIRGLIPLYKMGQVWHPPGRGGVLVDQLMRLGRSKYDDLADCFSYVNKIQTLRNIGRNPKKGSVYRGNRSALFQKGTMV